MSGKDLHNLLGEAVVLSEKYPGVKVQDNWTSLVLPCVFDEDGTMCGVVLVAGASIGQNVYWKFPGGRKEPIDLQSKDPPAATANRELGEETGITGRESRIQYVGHEKRSNHWRFLFTAELDENDLHWMRNNAPGSDGEKPVFFTSDEFYNLLRGRRIEKKTRTETIGPYTVLPHHAVLLEQYELVRVPVG